MIDTPILEPKDLAQNSTPAAVPATQPEPPAAPHSNTATGFTPIGQLFSDSWQLLKRNFLASFLITIIGGVASVVVGIVAVVALMATLFSDTNLQDLIPEMQANGPEVLSSLQFSLSPNSVAVIILVIAALAVVTWWFNGALMLLYDPNKKNVSFGEALKTGFSRMLPLGIAMLLAGALTFGGTLFFILPGIALYFLLLFASFEVLYEKRGPFAALQQSVSVTTTHLGPVLGRVLLMIGLQLVFFTFLPLSIQSMNETLYIIYSLFNFPISILATWYALGYFALVYRQARSLTPEQPRHSGLFWTLSAIGVLGFLFSMIMFSFIVGLARKFIMSPEVNEAFSDAITEELRTTSSTGSSETSTKQLASNTVPSTCGFKLELPAERSDERTPRYWIYEERLMSDEAFRNLAPATQTNNQVLGAIISFKTNAERLADTGSYRVGYPGFNIYCIDNTKDLELAEFIDQAESSKDRTITSNGTQEQFGELTVQPIIAEGLTNGDYYKEYGYIGVTPEKLIFIMPRGTEKDDELTKQIMSDADYIRESLTLD